MRKKVGHGRHGMGVHRKVATRGGRTDQARRAGRDGPCELLLWGQPARAQRKSSFRDAEPTASWPYRPTARTAGAYPLRSCSTPSDGDPSLSSDTARAVAPAWTVSETRTPSAADGPTCRLIWFWGLDDVTAATPLNVAPPTTATSHAPARRADDGPAGRHASACALAHHGCVRIPSG